VSPSPPILRPLSPSPPKVSPSPPLYLIEGARKLVADPAVVQQVEAAVGIGAALLGGAGVGDA